MKKLNELEILESRDVQIRSQSADPIENFRNKIDQLLDALNRVCLFYFKRKLFNYCIYLALHESKD